MLPKLVYSFNAICIKISMPRQKFMWKHKKKKKTNLTNIQNNPKEQEQNWRYYNIPTQIILQRYSDKENLVLV